MNTHGRTLKLTATALGAVALGTIGATAYGDGSGRAGAAQAPAVAELRMTANGNPKTPRYNLPGTIPAGLVKITMKNNTTANTDGQLVRVEGEHTDRQVLTEFGRAIRGRAVADWFIPEGGVGTVNRRKTETVTQVLQPGTYYVLGGDQPPKSAPARFVATGAAQGTLPASRSVIEMRDYGYRVKGAPLRSGLQQVEVRNVGRNFHHVLAARLRPGATAAQVRRFLLTEKGRPPFAGQGQDLETAVLDTSVSQIGPAKLKRGRYAFFCFVADRKGGPPHVAKGMVSTIRVR